MAQENKPQNRIAIFVSFSGDGGVERMITNLAKALVERGVALDILLIKASGNHVKQLPQQARIRKLRANHSWTSLPELIFYLLRKKPVALLAVKERAIKVAAVARSFAGIPGFKSKCRLVGRLGTNLSEALKQQKRNRLKIFWRFQTIRLLFKRVDQLVAVSEGVAKNVRDISGLDSSRVGVIRNPVITPELYSQAKQAVKHPWFESGQVAVILGVGRLTQQKDFDSLIRAFAQVRQNKACRLMILGDGKLVFELKNLAKMLDVAEHVAFPGFVSNPYAYMAKSRLFVLSSAWEGSPNALTEAMALGIPVVSTDCPSGPREILQDGQYGHLVKVGDVQGLAKAMSQTLEKPLAPQILKDAVADYSAEKSAQGYAKALGIEL